MNLRELWIQKLKQRDIPINMTKYSEAILPHTWAQLKSATVKDEMLQFIIHALHFGGKTQFMPKQYVLSRTSCLWLKMFLS